MKCPTCGQICRNNRAVCALCGTPLKQKRSHGGLVALIVILVLILGALVAYHFFLQDLILRSAAQPAELVELGQVETDRQSESAELPSGEGTAVEAPAAEASTAEAPAVEAPAMEAPAVEVPAAEASTVEAPAEEASTVEAPAAPSVLPDGLLFEGAAEVYAMPGYTLALCRDGSVKLAGQGASPEFGFDLFDWTNIKQVVPTDYFIAGLTTDGRVRLSGEVSGYEEAAGWTDVTRLYWDRDALLGLTKDGGVLAAGKELVEEPSKLSNIVEILPGYGDSLALDADGMAHLLRRQGMLWDADRTVGIAEVTANDDFAFYLMKDGSVRTAAYLYRIMDGYSGENPYYGWKDIEQLVICDWFVAGLTRDGRVLTATHLEGKAPDTSAWSGVIRLAADPDRGALFALTKEGRVLTTEPEAVSGPGSWENVKELQVNAFYVAGLTGNGRVLTWAWDETVPAPDTSDWRDISAISQGLHHLAGLRPDGGVLAAGDNSFGQCG